jgi:FkbM family methyltransferase
VLIELDGLRARQNFRIKGVLHVGAHLGEEHEAYLAHNKGQTWWVEGNPDLMDSLVANVSDGSNHRSHFINTLVGAEPERNVTLHVANNGMSSSVLELGTHRQAHPEVKYVGDVTADMTTIDRLVNKYSIRANFLNLDIQGYEMEALRGAERFLARQVQILYCEVNQDELYQGCTLLPEMWAWLQQRGFQLRELAMARGTGWGDAVFVKGLK